MNSLTSVEDVLRLIDAIKDFDPYKYILTHNPRGVAVMTEFIKLATSKSEGSSKFRRQAPHAAKIGIVAPWLVGTLVNKYIARRDKYTAYS